MDRLIICDWNRTLSRPEIGKLYADAEKFLEILNKEILILISQAEVAVPTDENLLYRYFKKIYVGPKKLILFRDIKEEYKNKKCWVVGDKIGSEIFLGNLSGYQTIRVRRGKFKDQQPACLREKADYEVKNLIAAAKIILSK